MKRVSALILALLLVLSVFCSCSVPHKKPDEETTAPQDEAPYFQLANLPKIGSYYDGVVYKRMTEDYVDSFQPSGQYGAVVPYLGDYRMYKDPALDADMFFDGNYARYGLMTADGTVITDAVYDYAYTKDDFIILTKTSGELNDLSEHCTVLPGSGKWSVEIEDFKMMESYKVDACTKYNRLFVCTGKELTGYDFNGKKVFATASEFIAFQVIEETGRILLTDYHDGLNSYKLLDMNGKELWSVEAVSLQPGEDSSRYFVGSVYEEVSSDGSCKSYCGIVNEYGEWVVSPVYRNTQVYGDRFFVCDDWYELVISDTNRKEIACLEGSGQDAPIIGWHNGELLYKQYNGASQRSLWCSVADGAPILPKGVKVVDVDRIPGTGLFFGVDEGGKGYLYTRGGTVRKTFDNKPYFSRSYENGMFEITTGSQQKRISHVINSDTMQEMFSYVCVDRANDTEIFTDSILDAQRYVIMRVSSISDEEADQIIRVCDIETGKVVLDGCDFADTFVLNGKTFCCAVKDNQSVVIDQDSRTLLRMPCSYLD